MFEIFNYQGKDKEELISKIQEELKTTREELILIEEEIEGKLFKNKKYNINVIKNSDVIAFIKDFIDNFQTLFGIEINKEIKIKDEQINIILVSENNAILIGKDGRTLKSLQTILRHILNRKIGKFVRVNVDVSGYKEKKKENLEYQTRYIAKDVLKTRIEAKLDPMNSYERRLVHSIVNEFKGLETISEGVEPERYVVIRYID